MHRLNLQRKCSHKQSQGKTTPECLVRRKEQQRTTMQTAFSKIAAALGIIFSVATFNPAFAAFSPTSELEARDSVAPAQEIEAQTELYCLALAVYFEGGSTAEIEDGQRHIARVVIDRAKENQRKWGGAKLCDVVFYKRAGVCQFSFACLPQAQRTPHGGAAWQRSFSIAQEELTKADVADDGIRYYLNRALTSNRNVCRFRREFARSSTPDGISSFASRPRRSAPRSQRASLPNARTGKSPSTSSLLTRRSALPLSPRRRASAARV